MTSVVWLIVTFVTAAEPQQVLLDFYRSVRPHVSGWQPIARLAPEIVPTHDLGRNLLSWVLGCAMVYLALFGLGHVLLESVWEGFALLAGSALCAFGLYRNLSRGGWNNAAYSEIVKGGIASAATR
jgi:hypothetical protein